MAHRAACEWLEEAHTCCPEGLAPALLAGSLSRALTGPPAHQTQRPDTNEARQGAGSGQRDDGRGRRAGSGREVCLGGAARLAGFWAPSGQRPAPPATPDSAQTAFDPDVALLLLKRL